MKVEQNQSPRLTLIGYGNPARGDDAAGPLLLQRIRPPGSSRFALNRVEALQLNPEHAYDLHGSAAVLFVDADCQCRTLRLQALSANPHYAFSSHSQTPASIMALHQTLGRGPPPPCFLLAIGGQQFGLGDAPSARCRDNLRQAERLLERLQQTDTADWLACWRQFAIADTPGAAHCA